MLVFVAERTRGKVSLYRGGGRGRPRLPWTGARGSVSARLRTRRLIVPPRFLPFLPTWRVFEAVADEADTLFQSLQCCRDRREVFDEAAADHIRHERQKSFRQTAPVSVLGSGSGLPRLYGGHHGGETGCDLFFHGAQPFHERR